MVKIRLASDNLEEIEYAIELLKRTFPNMRFSSPRLGSNPKYAHDPKYLSYGEPRIRNGKPIKTDFKRRLKNIKSKKSTSNSITIKLPKTR